MKPYWLICRKPLTLSSLRTLVLHVRHRCGTWDVTPPSGRKGKTGEEGVDETKDLISFSAPCPGLHPPHIRQNPVTGR
ncbi:uncharacterized protein BDZ83DRAFT_622213 [Colletotrichum acutatum]|uniref:Uncharacterized protein n=1 Tax=Glomerella acutata TaxID=27357 RepID=A0AAD8UMT2_GLOAC|nr:uncharacterized protein BDZ83DRAFT_622213 [Colletotrichum acutatum]KAK1724684.1 hypothetical protein BDZ83DRAFT_622213 [Colletotrichum acutatum]